MTHDIIKEDQMSYEIPPELERFLEREITSGRFTDRSAVIEHALRLMQRDREEAIRGVRAGLDDVQAGRTQPLGDAIDELRQDFGLKDA